jgi:16S rRNA processing protein RimM
MARRSISRSTNVDQRPTSVDQRPTSVDQRSTDGTDDVVVGVVRAPHGVRGEVKVEPLTDISEERFKVGSRLLCEGVGALTIARVRGTDASPIVRFKGYDDRSAAEALRNKQLAVPREEARRAAGEGYLWSDLVGMAVATPDGRELGAVAEIIRAGETDVLVVRGAAGETLLPALESVIKEVDLAHGRIVALPQQVLA